MSGTLTEIVDNFELFMFLDDNKLFSVIFKDGDSVVLQVGIEAMFNCIRNSLLFFLPDKCFTINVRDSNQNHSVITFTG